MIGRDKMNNYFMFPYYISTHAVLRFRGRIAPLCTRDIRIEIQKQLQNDRQELLGYARWDRQVNPVYMGKYRDKKYLIPTQMDIQKTGDIWPVVPTILPLKSMSYIHWERVNGHRKWMAMLEERFFQSLSRNSLNE